jgi:hypothetical protein
MRRAPIKLPSGRPVASAPLAVRADRIARTGSARPPRRGRDARELHDLVGSLVAAGLLEVLG